MAKFKEKIKAQQLRRKGESIKDIARKLKVSKGSVSAWCRDIELNPEQITRLGEKGYRGGLKGARVQKERRSKEISKLKREGAKLVGSLSKRDLLLIGGGLYWGEGAKQKRAKMINSNPDVIKFAIGWFEHIWGVPKNQFTLRVHINKIHQHRIPKVEEYWSRLTGIPKNQFNKTVLIRAKNEKVYENFENHYGTLVVVVRKSTDLRHRIEGLISGFIKEKVKIRKKKPV